jgi:hypothetical protein
MTNLRTLVHTHRERRGQRCRGAQECGEKRGHQLGRGLLHIQYPMQAGKVELSPVRGACYEPRVAILF